VTSEPNDLDDAVDQVRLAMLSEKTRPAVVFIDAINQVLLHMNILMSLCN